VITADRTPITLASMTCMAQMLAYFTIGN